MQPIPHVIDDAWTVATLKARTRSMAHRLLAGGGRAYIVAYDLDPQVACSTLQHGLSRFGDVVVAGMADTYDAVKSSLEPLRIRLDLVKEAPEFGVRITAHMAHALGTLTWLDTETTQRYVAGNHLDPRVAALAAQPDGLLGVIQMTDLYLHDSSGVERVSAIDVSHHHERCLSHGRDQERAFPDPHDEWQARDLLSEATGDDLCLMVDAPGAMRLATRMTETCDSVAGRVYCVDIDRFAVTVMQVTPEMSSIVLIPFPHPATSLADLEDRFAELLS